jgi:hypothetical protein
MSRDASGTGEEEDGAMHWVMVVGVTLTRGSSSAGGEDEGNRSGDARGGTGTEEDSTTLSVTVLGCASGVCGQVCVGGICGQCLHGRWLLWLVASKDRPFVPNKYVTNN